MSHGRERRGVTLLELIVVIAMLGLLLAIAAPAFILPTARARGDLHAVLAAARRTAILRAEPVTLSIDERGAWTLNGDGTSTTAPLATGTLDVTGDEPGRMKVRVSPLGSCVAEVAAPAVMSDWNAAGCGPLDDAARR